MTRDAEKEIQRLISAIPCEEPDRGKIKWRKRTWILPKGKTTGRQKIRRPEPEEYYGILKVAGKNVCVCELCGSDYKITVHHKDGNPYNNRLENLQVLCWHCHLLFHDPTEDGVHDELEGTKSDFDNLENPEFMKFYGITQEE